jgi:hypothetical protein
MKKIQLIVCVLAVPVCMLGQSSQSVKMNNNKISSELIKPELQYIFPDFLPGRVIRKDKPEVQCKLNYNFLLDEMLFIDENGNKMALSSNDDITQVYIGKRLFMPALKGYVEVIERGNIGLVYKWTCNIVEKGKEGALGLTTDAPSIYQMNQMSFDAKQWKLDVDKEAVVSVEVVPYLKVKSKYIQIKGVKAFYSALSSKKSMIDNYITQNPIDFKKETDLRKLTQYCNSL